MKNDYDFFSQFEDVCAFCEIWSNLVPVTFVLAFYVGAVVSRWWGQWNILPWPDTVAFMINAYCSGLVNFHIDNHFNFHLYYTLSISNPHTNVSNSPIWPLYSFFFDILIGQLKFHMDRWSHNQCRVYILVKNESQIASFSVFFCQLSSFYYPIIQFYNSKIHKWVKINI